MRKIIIKQGQSPGDILTMTRALGDLKMTYPDWQIDVRTPCPEIFENNPRLTPLRDDDPGIEIFEIEYGGVGGDIHTSGWSGLHFTDAFRHDMERKMGIKIKKTGIRPEIFVSDLEKSWLNQMHCEFAWDGPFWTLNAGWKQDNELKKYHRWQEVVDILNDYWGGKVKIVQIGHADHNHPVLKNVLNLIGKTDLRQLIRLAYWAAGSMGPLSFQFVLSAALEQPAVVIAGGKEGVKWHLYPNIRHIYANGCLSCCKWDGCWLGGEKGKCKTLVEVNGEEVPKCFDIIQPSMIADAVKMYYEGGVLKI